MDLRGRIYQVFKGETNLANRDASGGYLISLAKPGQAIRLEKLKAFGKLMICYASIVVGAKNVSVNN
jgi:hypothetical protein